MLLDILDEGMAHAYRMLTGTHQQIGIAVYIMYLEKSCALPSSFSRIVCRSLTIVSSIASLSTLMVKRSMRFSLTVCRYSTLPIWKSR